MWGLYRRLQQQGILSINQRNMDFVLKYNPRQFYPLVDDKLQTKQLAEKAGIAVPSLYTVIDSEHQLKNIDEILSQWSDFVIKPAHGAGGDGIIVVQDRAMGRYRQINGILSTSDDIRYHLSRLLSGAYSLGGYEDFALIEYRVLVDPVFAEVSYEGVPDIRIITLLGYPAIAMLRLPTRQSNGKANLHQGAIGVGIDIASGRTLGGVFHNDPIDFHPDTLKTISERQVPYWDDILQIAAACYELTGLGYLGVDIVLDQQYGPLMLELNARPGLNIQIANREGALGRYRCIEAQVNHCGTQTAAERVDFSKAAFAVNAAGKSA